MIINTYPMGDQQPTPNIVRNFYEAFQVFLRQNLGQFDTTDDAVTALMARYGIQASVCFHTIAFNELEPDYHHHYMIFGWLTEQDQQTFIERFDIGKEARLLQ